MAATILCRDAEKEGIQNFLTQAFPEALEQIREDESTLVITETETGLEVEFPVGEIYGYTYDYVTNVSWIFRDLKKDYPAIGINGLVYEYETTMACTQGCAFHCTAEEESLTINDQWQLCAGCDKVVETDTFYNSSQWDLEEGTLECLCCPTCMLIYALTGTSWDRQGVEPNASLKEDPEDLTFVITGKLESFENREELVEYIEDLGARVTGSISKKTNYLINNDATSNSSKNKKAKELGIPVITEQEFLRRFGDDDECWEEDGALEEYFWEKICGNLDTYMEDFAANRERILPLLELDDLPVERKAVLMEILHRTA